MVGYSNTASLRGEGLDSDRTDRRNRLHGIPIYALYIAGGWLLPGRKRIVPYSIQTLIAQRFPLAGARRAQEQLGKGGVIGKIVLVFDRSS